MERIRIGWVVRWAAPILALALAVPVFAQVSTGVIEVAIQDEDGLPLPGVTLRVENTETGADRAAVSQGGGQTVFQALTPGSYRVEANLDGFAAVVQDGLLVRIGQTVRVVITMRAQVSETITVTAEAPLVDVYKMDSSTNVVPEQIEGLPVQDREFEKLAFITPGVQRERGAFRFIQGGPVIGAGGNASQSTILVDGVEFTDQALGLSRTRFSQDAIREFRVISNRFDTEIGGSAGGALSVVTKSGTNQLHGSVFGFFRDDSLRAKGELETGDQKFQRYQVGFTIGGPIVEDQTHYFLSVEYIDEDDITPFRPGGAFANQAADYPNPKQRTLGLLSFDHRFSDSQTGLAKFAYEQYREDNFRVGGVSDVSNGQSLNRDNWNVVLGDTWVLTEGNRLNEARFQFGTRKYDEPTNAGGAPEEWFSGGTTLKIGTNIVGDLVGDGDYSELRDTLHWQYGNHDFKAGAAWFHVKERSVIDTFQNGLFLWGTDDRSFAAAYIYGEGSSDVTVSTDIYSVFLQDDWRAKSNVTLSLGLRYDYDTNGNNPKFEHPLTGRRSADANNFQPRGGFSWDISNQGASVLRGGVGLFTGRYLLVPLFTEEQQNGVTGRITRTRVSIPAFGLFIDPNDPEHTGYGLNPDITLLQDNLTAPESVQASLGFTQRLGDTGLYADLEGVYVDGSGEIVIGDANFGGNANPVRLNPSYNQINMYTNKGRSEYKAVTVSVNGTIGAGHIITASATWADKQNIADDFSPAFPTGYPSDPHNLNGEYGRSRADEEYRVVMSGVFRLPMDFTLAPILEYGSGQPWNHILGYDFNGDGKNSDRPEGVKRNSMEGPEYKSVSLRLTKAFRLGNGGDLELIAEAFNLFNWTNYDVTSVNNAEFFAGPTLANPAAQYIANPDFGTYRATLDPREIQLGMRYRF